MTKNPASNPGHNFCADQLLWGRCSEIPKEKKSVSPWEFSVLGWPGPKNVLHMAHVPIQNVCRMCDCLKKWMLHMVKTEFPCQ